MDGDNMTFIEWFENNKEELSKLLHGDKEDALYLAWYAGYKAGLDSMGDFTKKLWEMQ
jgi:hypothetical protein